MHKITLLEENEGLCAKCGPVDLRSYKVKKTGVIRYRCPNSYLDSNKTRKRHAGLTSEERVKMIMKSPKCEICGRKLTTQEARIDHCHDSGKVRGVLCNDCNVGLGFFKDNIERMRSAIKYLRRN